MRNIYKQVICSCCKHYNKGDICTCDTETNTIENNRENESSCFCEKCPNFCRRQN